MITQDDIRALKAYVAAPGTQSQAESTVRLNVSHSNLKARFMEIRLDSHMTVDAVKHKLVSHCGTSPECMQLYLKDEQGNVLCQLSDAGRQLGFYSPHDGYTLHIKDLDLQSMSANSWLEDTSKVQKYEMSDAAYNQRENTYRKYKQAKLKEDPEWTAEKELCMRKGLPYVPPKKKIADDDLQAAAAQELEVGQRCQVDPGSRRGTIRFVGRCEGLPKGFWVGVQFDEPVGKNNGTVKGQKFFDCPPGYGGFQRPDTVQTGNFPELDVFDEDDEI